MLSIVIPVWSGTAKSIEMHLALAQSVVNDCDELIICEDGPYCRALALISTIYLTHPRRLGHAQNLQSGINVAHGEFIGVLDSDVAIIKGSMRDLCTSDKFASGKCLNQDTSNSEVFYIWCSVGTKELYQRFPLPTDGEMLDAWARTIPRDLRVEKDVVEYTHSIGVAYTELKVVGSHTEKLFS